MIGASVKSSAQRNDLVLILRDENEGIDTAYQIEEGKGAKVVVDGGQTKIDIKSDQVIVDVTNADRVTVSIPQEVSSVKSATDTIDEYVAFLNRGRYRRAFAILSDGFKSRNHCCDNDGNYQIQPYIDYWSTIDQLEVQELYATSVTETKATVNTPLVFKRANLDDVFINYQFTMIKEGDNWYIDKVSIT